MTDRGKAPPSRPRAFRLDDPKVVFADRDPPQAQPRPDVRPDPRSATPPPAPPRDAVVVEPQPDPYAREVPGGPSDPQEAAVEEAQKSGIRARSRWTWGSLFWSAIGSLVSLAFGLWLTSLVESFFARSLALGWVGVTLLAFAGISLLALLLREFGSIARQSRIARIHAAFAVAREADDRDGGRRLVGQMIELYTARPELASARATVQPLTSEIIDGRDLIDIAERNLMRPLDKRVRREIAQAAKRVSVVTAISPRAILDVVFVVGQAVYLMRRIAQIYGGRPGFFGFFKLARSVTAHLAITGGMAVGDSILQTVLGHGIAARISTRLGEGVLNGLLTTRIGLSAMSVCRPMPFAAEPAPGVKDVAPFLFGAGKE